jgi:hypothetical protein
MDILCSPVVQEFGQDLLAATPQQPRRILNVDGCNMSPAGQQGEEPPEEVPLPEQAESPTAARKRKRKAITKAANEKHSIKRRQQAAWFKQKEAVEAAALEATRKHEDLLQQLQQAQELLKDSRRRERQQISRNLHEQQLQLSKQHHADMQKKEAASYRKGRAAAGADQQLELQQAEKVVGACKELVVGACKELEVQKGVTADLRGQLETYKREVESLRAAPLLPDPFDDIEENVEGYWKY